MDQSLAPVLLGVGTGIILIAIVVSISQSQATVPLGPLDTQRPRSQFGDTAIQIALQNDTLQQEFSGSEIVITSYRDWGVAHSYYDCPINWCAHITFADKSDTRKSVAVLVNMNSSKVVEIRAANSLLISKVSETEEAKIFLSRYPNSESSVNVGPGYSAVMFEAGNVTRFLTLSVKTTPIGTPIEMSIECLRDGGTFKSTDVMEYLRTQDCLT